MRRPHVPWIALVAIGLSAEPAHAYLDPGSGSVILQALLAGLMAGLYLLRSSWDKIKNWFRSRDDRPSVPR